MFTFKEQISEIVWPQGRLPANRYKFKGRYGLKKSYMRSDFWDLEIATIKLKILMDEIGVDEE